MNKPHNKSQTVGRVSDSVTRQAPDAPKTEHVGLRCANPTYEAIPVSSIMSKPAFFRPIGVKTSSILKALDMNKYNGNVGRVSGSVTRQAPDEHVGLRYANPTYEAEFIETVYGKLPLNLKEAKLSTICEKNGVQTGPFGSQLHKEDYVVKGTPIITVEHLGENRIVHENLPRVSDADRTRLSKYQLKTGDIVFSRVGSVDRRALVQAKEDGWLFSGRCLRVRPIQEIVDSRWLSYFFGLPAFKNYIRGIAVGATMPSLNTKILSDVPIYFPPLDIQKSAAKILIDLDDRIALLRETNTTLEAIAQALFKSWFVDFDPVRAKQQGREPEGMDAETATLFPDSFEESELGLVPSGWRVGTLGQIADTVRSQRQPSKLNSDTNYVGLEHIPRRCLSLSNWGSAEVLESAKSCFSKDDILFGKLRPYFHKVVIAPFDGVCSTDILVCQSKLPEYYGLVTMHLFSKTLIDYAERLSNGAKMPRINWKDLAAYPIVLPPKDVAENYRTAVELLFQAMLANVQQIKTLTILRDTLLPRLISGQLRLPEAKTLLEETIA